MDGILRFKQPSQILNVITLWYLNFIDGMGSFKQMKVKVACNAEGFVQSFRLSKARQHLPVISKSTISTCFEFRTII